MRIQPSRAALCLLFIIGIAILLYGIALPTIPRPLSQAYFSVRPGETIPDRERVAFATEGMEVLARQLQMFCIATGIAVIVVSAFGINALRKISGGSTQD